MSSIKLFLCDIFGVETKAEKEQKAKEKKREQGAYATMPEQQSTSNVEKEKKKEQWADVNEQVKYVCDGGKIQCTFCNPPIADIIVTSTTIMLQDKPWATVEDCDGQVNFKFTGVCMHPSEQKPFSPPPPCKSIIKLGKWKNFSETFIDDKNAQLMKSTIPCNISKQDLKIIHSGQMAELTELVPMIKKIPKIIDVYWKEEGKDEKHRNIFSDSPINLQIETVDFDPGELFSVTIKNSKKRKFENGKEIIRITGNLNEKGILQVDGFQPKYETPKREMAQLLCYNAGDGKEGGKLAELPAFLVHFRRCDDYDGGFGFDWMRDEYIYEKETLEEDYATGNIFTRKHPSVCGNKEELKSKYEKLYEKKDAPYYIPFLSMFVNHEQKTGNKVELLLQVEKIDPKWKKAKIKFDCPPGITIVPEEIELTEKDAILQTEKDLKGKSYTSKKITIFCNKEHLGEEIKIVSINKNEEVIVGKLKLFPNKEYPLNIRIVKLLRQEYLDSDREFVDDQMNSIVSYLKNKSLQQAMIVPQIETGVKEIIISEEQWKIDGKMVFIDESVLDHHKHVFREYQEVYELQEEQQDCKEYEEYEEYKNFCKNKEYKEYEVVRKTKECVNGKKMVKTHNPYKGIVLILSNINHKRGGAAGMANFHPSQGNICFITRLGMKYKVISPNPQKHYQYISHEIGHVLGLDHTFENYLIINDALKEYNEAKNRLPSSLNELPIKEIGIIKEKKKKDELIAEMNKYIKTKDVDNEHICKINIETLSENINISSHHILECKESILTDPKIVESYEWFRDHLDNNRCYLFDKGTTDNIMDYYLITSKHYVFSAFCHWQWRRMQDDLTKFHS